MATTTAKGIPVPTGTDNNDVPASMLALANWMNTALGPFTTTQLNAMAAADKWEGRAVWNSTTKEFWYWDGTLWAIQGAVRGEIRAYGGTTLPAGAWNWARGAAISRTTYAALFALFGTKFGAGDGSTTFNLPDSRKRGFIGASQDADAAYNDVGIAGGAATYALTAANMLNHVHENVHGHTATGSSGAAGEHFHFAAGDGQFVKSGLVSTNGSALVPITGGSYVLHNKTADATHYVGSAVNHTHPITVAVNNSSAQTQGMSFGGDGAAFSIVSPYLTVNYIVKL